MFRAAKHLPLNRAEREAKVLILLKKRKGMKNNY
jgi:hypothetical protein